MAIKYKNGKVRLWKSENPDRPAIGIKFSKNDKSGISPAPRHAELAVNLSGTMAAFLFQTLESRKKLEKGPPQIGTP